MFKIIKVNNINIYHSGNNNLKYGYLTWFTDNIDYIN